MQISGAPTWATMGALIALIVLILAVLGAVGVLPFTPVTVFVSLGLLAIARLVETWDRTLVIMALLTVIVTACLLLIWR